MYRNHPDAVGCGKRTGPDRGLLCENCEGKCPRCDSHADPTEPVYICGDCAFGNLKEKCILCGGPGKYPAMYCRECVLLGRHRDGCPRIVDAGLSRNDMLYERRKAMPSNH